MSVGKDKNEIYHFNGQEVVWIFFLEVQLQTANSSFKN